ncbi:hypothetical protein BH11ARM2_BH11ARM2_02810 [soil metagenome]
MKAMMVYRRKAVRDFLDLAALSEVLGSELTVEALLELDRLYAGQQTRSLRLEVAKALSESAPTDLEAVDLSRYKGLAPKWRDWKRTEGICQALGKRLGERSLEEET